MHWVSKVVKATVGAAEGRAYMQNDWHIARKANYIYDVTTGSLQGRLTWVSFLCGYFLPVLAITRGIVRWEIYRE